VPADELERQNGARFDLRLHLETAAALADVCRRGALSKELALVIEPETSMGHESRIHLSLRRSWLASLLSSSQFVVGFMSRALASASQPLAGPARRGKAPSAWKQLQKGTVQFV
jgi:hypothetical protein